MKKHRFSWLLIGFTALMMLLLTGCGGKTAALPLDNSRLVSYVAKYAGAAAEAGVMEVSFKAGNPGAWQVETKTQLPGATVTSSVQLNQYLLPLSSLYDVEVANAQGGKVTTTYTGKQVLMDAETPNGPQKIERKLTGNYYDNEQLVATIAALKLEPKQRYTFTLIVPQSALKLTPAVWLEVDEQGKAVVEQVTTPAGTFESHKVILNAGVTGAPDQTFWISTSGPAVVTKYYNGATEYTLQELVTP